MPPPGVWGLDGELEGVEPSRMESMVEELLQGIYRFLRQGGYTEPPISFSFPKAYFFVDGKTKVVSNRFVLTPDSEEAALLLYIALSDYHWESGIGSEIVLIKLWNPGFQTFFQNPRYRRIPGTMASMTTAAFLQLIGERRAGQGIGY